MSPPISPTQSGVLRRMRADGHSIVRLQKDVWTTPSLAYNLTNTGAPAWLVPTTVISSMVRAGLITYPPDVPASVNCPRRVLTPYGIKAADALGAP